MVEQQLVPARRRSVNNLYRGQQVGGVLAGFGLLSTWYGGAIGTSIGLPIFAGVYGLLFMLGKRQARRFVVENQVAADALHRGDLTAAHDIWDYWSEIRNNRRVMVVACHNLASVWIQQGKLLDAKRLHTENSEFELRTLRRVGLTKLSAASVAYTCALMGEIENANKWIAIAGQRTKPPQSPNADSLLTIARVIVDLRTGRNEEAALLLEDNWTLIEGRVHAGAMRECRVLRAFARAAGGPREAGRVHDDVAAGRPRYPGEHSYLATSWPEMAAFLAANELDR